MSLHHEIEERGGSGKFAGQLSNTVQSVSGLGEFVTPGEIGRPAYFGGPGEHAGDSGMWSWS